MLIDPHFRVLLAFTINIEKILLVLLAMTIIFLKKL